MAWPEAATIAAHSVLAIPVGSTEQHGPHLPLTTDTDIAVALTVRLADRLDDVIIAPALPFGSSGEHAGFSGTLSIGGPALERLVVELVRSADAFAGVVLVSGHGGNAEPLGDALSVLRSEGRRAMVWSPVVPGGDAHAGHSETSMMLALRPAQVAMAAARPGDTRTLGELLPLLRAGGVASVSANGVLGDPAEASCDQGATLLDQLEDDLVAAVRRWRS
ncbi:MAG: mycofactocin biosynthesis peptidyl-dipeptidase MftE [Acidimicrobiales bacterium]